jgi:PD-(D/E)XK nuclease superfamily
MKAQIERLSFRDGLQFAWDSTSLSLLKACPRKYQYSILQGWAPRSESVHLTFGILYHNVLEVYDHRIAEGQPHDYAVKAAIKHCMIASREFKSDDPNKNRFTLIRSAVWYLEQFKDDPFRTVKLANGKPAVEMSFRFALNVVTPDGEPYLYSGHLDRLAADTHGDIFVMDRKTTKQTISSNFFDKFNPNNQMSGYTVGAKIAYHQPVKGVVIDGVQVAVTFSRFARGFSPRTPDQLDEWLDEVNYYIKMAEGFYKSDFWPMNDTACDMYGGCQFREICSKGGRLRDTWLAASYVRRYWDPLKTRGDI